MAALRSRSPKMGPAGAGHLVGITGMTAKRSPVRRRSLAALRFLWEIATGSIARMSDARLESLTRQQIHGLEVGLGEDSASLLVLLRARRLFSEARKRGILSPDEIRWARGVLFGAFPPPPTGGEGPGSGLAQVIRERRSIRAWREEVPSDAAIQRLVDAARWAPSSCNRQPCRFLVTTRRGAMELLAQASGQRFVARAPACILVLVNMQAYVESEVGYTPYLDAGAAVENLLLQAHAEGLGACWINFGDKEVQASRRAEIQEAFGIPAGYRTVSLVALGFPATAPAPPGRKALSDVLRRESW